MCCMDWGAQHCIGYINEEAFKIKKINEDLANQIKQNKKGFELLKKAKKPSNYNTPPEELSTLDEIWRGKELFKVRKCHYQKTVDDLEVCKKCTFRDTYDWEKVTIEN